MCELPFPAPRSLHCLDAFPEPSRLPWQEAAGDISLGSRPEGCQFVQDPV